jgi:hypothetical protein
VEALAGSISLRGMLVPLVVREDGDGFELVAALTACTWILYPNKTRSWLPHPRPPTAERSTIER